MGAITDLFNSERGLLAVLLIIGATVLTALHVMTVTDWKDFATYVFGVYTAGKTVTGAVGMFTNKNGTAKSPSATPTLAPVTAPAEQTK